MTVLPSFCHFFVLLLHNFRYAPYILLRLYYLSALFFPCGGRRTRVSRPQHECMTAVGSVADGRHTHRTTAAVRAADGRRTMNKMM